MKSNKLIFISQPGIKKLRKKNVPWRNPDNPHFFLGDTGIAHFLAKYILSLYPKFRIEIWRLDQNVKKRVEKSVNNIKGVIYPYRGKKNFPFSIKFVLDLRKEIKKNDVIIWFDGLHNKFFMLLSLFFKNTFQVCNNLGGSNFSYKYEKTGKKWHSFASLIERKIFVRNIDIAFLGANGEFNYFKKELPDNKISIQYVTGINFERWKVLNKKDARKELGLPSDKKIILQAGRGFFNKGTHITIRAWQNYLKEKGILLYLTGIHESDEVFPLIKESGCEFRGMIDHDVFPLWMAAVDVYIYPPFDDETLNFAGIGYAPLEALATGTPVVCTTARFLQYYGINKKVFTSFIKIPESEKEVAEQVLELLKNPPDPEECHGFVQEYFSQEILFDNIEKKINENIPGFFN